MTVLKKGHRLKIEMGGRGGELGKPKRGMFADFQKIHTQIRTEPYPIPGINITIQNLGRAKIFSTIDLESGFTKFSLKKNTER